MNSRIELATKQIGFARGYFRSLLTDIDDADWLKVPNRATTHVAWQVGHVAMAQYGLCLFRQRGRAEVDSELMPSKFRKLFSRGSIVELDPQAYPSPADIRAVFDRVEAQVLQELPTFPDADLDSPVEMPYAGYSTRFGALLFSSHHEMIHAGQVGMLRRLLGKAPIR